MDACHSPRTRTSPLERWRRHVRRGCDAGSASMVSYVVAASVFLLGSTFLVSFVVEPPGGSTATLEHVSLKSQAQLALATLLGGPGYPPTWQSSADSVDNDLTRLGIVAGGTSLRIDPEKFDALARGRYATASNANGFVDYAEAKEKLGLGDYEFHLRAYPLLSPGDDGTYGTSGMGDFRVGYIGRIDSQLAWSAAATKEADALVDLDIGFSKSLRSLSLTGDVYMDSASDLRANLMPNIGVLIQQTVLAGSSGSSFDFQRVSASTYDALAAAGLGLTNTGAMALTSDGSTLGYTKSRELRAIVGSANPPEAVTSMTLTWREFVDTDKGNGTYDCGDYGYVEYSRDGGATWVALTSGASDRSQDCDVLPALPHGNVMKSRTATLNCGASCGNVLLAFRWIGDNDHHRGYGWVVDDIRLVSGGGLLPESIHLVKTFETPEYDMLIVGSSVLHSALTPEDVKGAIRDYVDKHGGRLVVLGGQTNVNWLDRLFDVGVAGGSGGLSVPDVTHPLLTLPNRLDYADYALPTSVYQIEEPDDALFSPVVTDSGGDPLLAVAREGAWGTGSTYDGSVVLSSYQPHTFSSAQLRSFLANSVVYGKFHYLYLEVGPTVPESVSVASASRTATMNMYRDGENYTQMAFVMYVWPGQSASATLGAATVQPLAPTALTATAGSGSVNLLWSAPSSWGTGEPLRYDIYRGHSPHPTTVIGTTAEGVTSYADSVGVVDGTTYYYAVRAVSQLTPSDVGRSGPSEEASVTPLSAPGAPTGLAATSGLGYVDLSWNAPVSTGGGTILGYKLYVANTSGSGSFALLSDVGSTLTYRHTVVHSDPMDFRVRAVNGAGTSAESGTVTSQAMGIVAAPTLTAAQGALSGVSLAWTAPALLGQTPLSYKVYRSATENGEYAHLATTGAANVSFDDLTTGPGATWWYRVSLVTNVGETAQSTANGATSKAAPSAPSGLTATNVLGVVTVTWLAPASESPILYYELYKGNAATSTPTKLSEPVTLAATTALDASNRWYRVKAVSAAGASDWSNADDA